MTGELLITIKERKKQYPILIGQNLKEQLVERVKNVYNGDKILLVTDDNVRSLYAEKVWGELNDAGYQVFIYSIKPGEGSKSYQSLIEGHRLMTGNNFSRDSLVIALGGGVVGDLAGFIAATYMRGIPFIQVPTTLLAQVDSSVGGKTAINHQEGKNLIGAFYQPQLVLIDSLFLKTLPERELKNGLAELIKHGLIADRELNRFMLKNREAIFQIEPGVLGYIIKKSCQLKANIVSEDEKERGRRAILNFGHTIGHALEAVTSYRCYRHGEAVAVGMIGAARLSKRLSCLSEDELELIEKIIQTYDLPTDCQYGEERKAVFERLFYDKKARGKKLRWVLLDGIGQAFIESEIEHDLIKEVLEGLL
ncbi:MAG TPA: 3-dehydroquinate synthase [Halanaerobiales bacterium]|nr:3-dehydroquinate synthase [Halanaerobiales bacterium]